MNTPNTTPRPTEWHRRQKGYKGQCLICGCPGRHLGEHRRIPQSENANHVWEKRRKSATGWQYYPIGSKRESEAWRRRSAACDDLVRRLDERHEGRLRVSRRSRELLLSAIVLAERLGQHWLDDAIEATVESQAAKQRTARPLANPIGFLRSCLTNGLEERLGIPRGEFPRMLAKVRPSVGCFMRSDPRPSRPDEPTPDPPAPRATPLSEQEREEVRAMVAEARAACEFAADLLKLTEPIFQAESIILGKGGKA